MSDSSIAVTVQALTRRIEVLEAEADIRRLQARYMFLCDTPCPESGIADHVARVEKILELYAEDAIWEGVGEYHANQFGRMAGKDALRDHFRKFWDPRREPKLLLNAHYLTSEQIHVHDDGVTADGQWIHMQPWLFSDGKALLRSSRLNNHFRKIDDRWLIARTRTESVLVAPLPDNFAEFFPSESVLMEG
ncbi:MAG TPA: nuclear transport factor 2 family protein [Trinickia sp.]|uniref:nuclear transport factor 2 family protein n=1 Tax=Trinickia sp. TaxID=2571163 RepID=UPI002BCD0EB7|nr:nuclear transport factor 2 family protein [Trinickia sp.]HVW51979.1 nuclear transport factor 2 family protein [Trinickia sp.]